MSAEFIKMVADLHSERFIIHLAQLVKERTPCGIFFGFNLVPRDAQMNFQALRKVGLNFTCAIVVSDVDAYLLESLGDVPVITPEDFERFGEENFPVKPQEIFIPGTLKDCGFVPYFARHGMEVLTCSDDGMFFFMMTHLSELYSVYKMLGSEESKKVFRAAIKGRLTGKISDYRFAPEPQYFLEGFTPTAGDIAVDGGAYDGGTAIAFAKCGAKVFAFEMDAANYKNCAARIGQFGGGMILPLKISA